MNEPKKVAGLNIKTSSKLSATMNKHAEYVIWSKRQSVRRGAETKEY